MRQASVRLREDFSIPDDPADLDARETAKARQDLSHRKLDRFIAAALAELSDDYRAAQEPDRF
jgi:hypothetical protein